MSKKIFILILLNISLVTGMIIMARGHEDWFIDKQAFGKALSDVGELGARLGIPYSFTRSGKVVYSDGFEASLAPWQVITGTGYGTVVRDDEITFRGAYSCKMTPSADAPQRSEITKTVPYILSSKMGLEVMVAGETAADDAFLRIEVRRDDVYYRFLFKIVLSNTTLFVLTGMTEWTAVADIGGDIAEGVGNFILTKMIIDADTMKYHSVQINDNVYDISTLEPYSFTSELPNAILIGLKAEDTSADQGIIRFDDVTFTIDEP